jgi:hypothetical protein
MRHRKSFTQAQKITAIIIYMLLLASGIFAQNQIVFINPSQGKLIKAKEGDMLSIRYTGYLGQTETFKNTLTFVSDSTFTLGIPMMGTNGLFSPNLEKQFMFKEIRCQDVIAFRRSGLGRTMLKSTLTIGSAVGSFILLNSLYGRNNISDFGKIGISVGIGLSLSMIINLALPDKPNHKMEEGWEIKILKD